MLQNTLALFPVYNRSDYKRVHGSDAPPYDSSRPIKRWYDPSTKDTLIPNEIITYQTVAVGSKGEPEYLGMSMPLSEAASVNLPGEYAKHDPKETKAKFTKGYSTTIVDRFMLSTFDEALIIADELKLDRSTITRFPCDVPTEDNRNIFTVKFKDKELCIGYLLKEKFHKGIGAPGSWNLDGDYPLWVSSSSFASIDKINSHPEIPVPCRQLGPDEVFAKDQDGEWIVRKLFSPEHTMIKEIHDKVVNGI